MVRLSDKGWLFVFTIVLGLLAIIYNPTIAFIYGLFILGSYIIDDSAGIRFKVNGVFNNTPRAILIAMFGMVIFLMLSFILSFALQAATPLLQGNFITNYLKIFSSQTPLLADNKILTLFTFSVPIAFIETLFFFAVSLTFLIITFGISFNERQYSILGFNIKLPNGESWIVILFLSAMFTIFHFQVRGLTDNVGLIGTFLFAVISLIMVQKVREAEPALWFHGLWNFMVSYQNLYGRLPFLRY